MPLKDFIHTTQTSFPDLKLIFQGLKYKFQSLIFIFHALKYRLRSECGKFGLREK